MISSQQKETLCYFDGNAREWQALANDKCAVSVNTLQQRYQYGLSVAKRFGPFRSVLDLGCGSGDALWGLAEAGADCFGIDFSEKMIELAGAAAIARRLSNCKFVVGNVLEYSLPQNAFDLVLCYGVIEYFSYEETERFFAKVFRALQPGGVFIVETRNRLFNLVSFNDYTAQEIATGNLDILFEEAMALTTAQSMDDCIARLRCLPRTPTVLAKYPIVGVPVTVRHQYTPAQMCALLESRGLMLQAISGYHYHGLVPAMKEKMAAVHAAIANLVQTEIVERHEAIVHCSSFMVRAARPL